ncbi:hypothetical protein GN244_ATG14343 [Phytophthora infestans]|uniref:Uncharacterized protein n=1 Tax=Phytophthora infestans TaxID=4787 RepID=A0A833VY94_PHYIN|nr:hypothetical protein GN244_ATG14343 [Phytophthora infestans]
MMLDTLDLEGGKYVADNVLEADLDTLDLEGGKYVADDVLEADAVGANSLSAQYESEAQGESTTAGHDVCERERSQQTLNEPSAAVNGTEVGVTITDEMTMDLMSKTQVGLD